MRSCYVTGCDRKHRSMNQCIRMMFFPPKDPNDFQIWKKLLQGKRDLTARDRICEAHFDEEDILKTWEHNINGQIHKIVRLKPMLRPKAVPKHELESLFELRAQPSTKTLREIPRKPRLKPKTFPEEIQKKSTAQPKSIVEDVDIEMATPEEIVHDLFADVGTNELTEATFDGLYDDVFEVELPCTMYGVHRDPERTFIAFTLIDPTTMATSKALHIDRRLRTRTIVDGRHVNAITHDDLSPETVSEMLANLDAMQRCANIRESNDCLAIAVDGQKWCESCALSKS